MKSAADRLGDFIQHYRREYVLFGRLRGFGLKARERPPPGGRRGAGGEKGAEMMLEIIKVLIALPPSMVAAVMLYHLVRPGKGKHREKDRQ